MGVDENSTILADGQSLITGNAGEGGALNWTHTAGAGITIITPEQAVYSLQNQQQVVLAGGGGTGSSDQIPAQQDAGAGKYSPDICSGLFTLVERETEDSHFDLRLLV